MRSVRKPSRKRSDVDESFLLNFLGRLYTCDLVLVEGKKDAEVLVGLGVDEGKIVKVGSKSCVELLEALVKRKPKLVAILTDLDEEGRRKFKEIRKLLESRGIRVEGRVRKLFKLLFRSGKVEEVRVKELPLSRLHRQGL